MTENISLLKKELNEAIKIDEKRLADEIRAIGFHCIQCAKCCKSDYGDNTVSVFPNEIRLICEKTGNKPYDIVIPTPSNDKDEEENIHTFEWVIRKDRNCIFLKNDLCEIYEWHPHICSTYPFYLREGKIKVCECDGLGKPICHEESQKIAETLKERYITEIKESILLLAKFSGFRPGGKGICVHDSEGEHWVI